MTFTGTFWLLWEDEPIDADQSWLMEFRGGAIIDSRTGERAGTYNEAPNGIDATFNEKDGDEDLVQFRMPGGTVQRGDNFEKIERPFDPNADCYPLTWTSVRFEAYRATLPAQDNETDEQLDARYDRDEELFGVVPRTFGFAIRDGEEARQIAAENARGHLTAT